MRGDWNFLKGTPCKTTILFPNKLTRRDFFAATGAVAAGLALNTPSKGRAAEVKIGDGKATYTLDESWGKLPRA